jgi:3-phosphoshikimate 1-carboxyvinyltransferase
VYVTQILRDVHAKAAHCNQRASGGILERKEKLMNAVCKPCALQGTVRVPGSKSHTIRAVLLGALARGTTVIHNPLGSADALSALRAAEAFGAAVTSAAGLWTVTGRGLRVPDDVLDCGNSGTTTNFAMALAALCDGYTVLTGDYQIRRRPVSALAAGLRELGATAFLTRPGQEAPPVVVGGRMRGGTAHFSGFNSQVVSAVLLAAPLCRGRVAVEVENPREKPYVQMTIDWMKRCGVELAEQSPDYKHFCVEGGQAYRAVESTIPSDWSGVAFPLVAALCTPSTVTIAGVDFADAQGDKIVVDHLIALGADVTKDRAAGTLTVRGGKPLRGGTTIDLNDTPDALPALCVAACYATGDTTFTGLAHVRVKETDRVAVMASELGKLGARIDSDAETMTVHGGPPLQGATVESHDDHRVAMSLCTAGLFAAGSTTVKDADCASVSFPGFFDLMRGVGAAIKEEN